MNNPKFIEDQLIQTLERAERLANKLNETSATIPGTKIEKTRQMNAARIRIDARIKALQIALNKI